MKKAFFEYSHSEVRAEAPKFLGGFAKMSKIEKPKRFFCIFQDSAGPTAWKELGV